MDTCAKAKTHAHIPLTNPATQIRLLTCDKVGEVHNHLALRTVTFTRAEAPPYAAVSHLWDKKEKHDTETSSQITLNGYDFPVSDSLRDFLAVFDHSQWKEDRPSCCWLWIDAICIDQSSLVEKNGQVPVMGQIFQQAVCVFAWLGTPGNVSISSGSFDLTPEDCIRELAHPRKEARGKTEWSGSFVANSRKAEQYTWAQLFLEDSTDGALRSWRRDIWRTFAAIERDSIWRRVWIYQELLLAQDIVLCVGTGSVAWKYFAAAFHNLQENISRYKNHHHIDYIAWTMREGPAMVVVQQRNVYRPGSASALTTSKFAPLETVLETCVHLTSTLVHDRIYALLGLAHDGAKVHVDYADSLAEVYINTLKALEPAKKPITLNRNLLRGLSLFYERTEISKALRTWSDHGKETFVRCIGTCRSHVLDASLGWEEGRHKIKGLVDQEPGRPRAWWRKYPTEWTSAWQRQHGSEEKLIFFPDKQAQNHPNEESRPYLWRLHQEQWYGYGWPRGLNQCSYAKLENTDEQEPVRDNNNFPAKVTVTDSEATSADAAGAVPQKNDESYDEDYFRPQVGIASDTEEMVQLFLGARGEVGISSSPTHPGDLIIEMSNSRLYNNPPIFLLARKNGPCFDIIARAFLRHHWSHIGPDGLDVTAVSSLAAFDHAERLGPPETIELRLDIRALHHLSQMLQY